MVDIHNEQEFGIVYQFKHTLNIIGTTFPLILRNYSGSLLSCWSLKNPQNVAVRFGELSLTTSLVHKA